MLDLAHIRKLAHAATKGPWTVGQRWEDEDADMANWLPINRPAVDPDNPHQPERVALIRYYPGGFQHPHYEARSDAEFIAAARELVPAMADEIERLLDELGRERMNRAADRERANEAARLSATARDEADDLRRTIADLHEKISIVQEGRMDLVVELDRAEVRQNKLLELCDDATQVVGVPGYLRVDAIRALLASGEGEAGRAQ